MKKIGIYVHIPFCAKKCEYCDFTSFAGKTEFVNEYIEKLDNEIIEYGQRYSNDYVINTIYIGGGTPSYIGENHIESIVSSIKTYWKVEKNAEITIEVNPGTVDVRKLRTYKKVGVNRVSMGIQSDNNLTLKTIGRIHTYEEAIETYNLARNVGFNNINVDLMIGLPTQDVNNIEKMIKHLEELKPEHISVYSLIVEDGTRIHQRLENKELYLPSENIERKMYWEVKRGLKKIGYEHYEISNFAKRGYKSKHNWNCWNQEEYLGFGLAAHSYLNNERFANTDELNKYLKGGFEKESLEKQDSEEKMREYMLLGLRKIAGVKIAKFKEKFGINPIFLYRIELEKLVNEKLLKINGDYIKLTNKGIDLANVVWQEFVEEV